MTAWIGLLLLPLAGLAMAGTGLPAFLMLLFAAGVGAGAAALAGNGALLAALPGRLTGLMESDLLQALPLFVLMGTLINRLPLAAILFRSGRALAGSSPAAPQWAALGLGALLAPMNGSVGASVSVMSRSIRPMLAAEGVAPAERVALLAAASTLGVVVPPSLVLIFLGDAMMSAHTIAVNATKRVDQIINTQDVFRAALVPAALTLFLWALAVMWRSRSRGAAKASGQPPLTIRERLTAAVAVIFILSLLGGVATGLFYAVEAAAMGCVALLVAAAASGYLRGGVLGGVLNEALAISGALFALLVAATTFTLVLRILGVDALLTAALAALPGGERVAVGAGLAMLMLAALVLDAFEIIFVIIPILMPGMLMRAPDAAWVAALTILALQASFLVPPVGYAIMMARSAEPESFPVKSLVRALAPFLSVPAFVVMLTLAFPQLTHLLDRARPPAAAPLLSEEEIRKQFQVPLPEAPPLSLPAIKLQ